MKPSFLLLSSLLAYASASPRINRRDSCTVKSLNNPSLDDVPAIAAALKKCGVGGGIELLKDTTYTIRTPLDLSPCRSCDFQLNGLFRVSNDWAYWKKQTAVFKISNATAVIISSNDDTGLIDAQNFGLTDTSTVAPAQIPKLFSISDESYQVHFRNLKFKNVPGIGFYINSHSSAVRLYGLEFETPATTAYFIEQAQHVYLWNTTTRARENCVAVLPNSTNIQLQESTCITTSSNTESSGLKFQLLASTGLGWIRNIFVKDVRAVGSMNVISFVSGGGGGPQTIEITNATFTGITIEGPARQAFHLQEPTAVLNATQVTFKNFQGEAEKESTFTCANPKDICDFKVEDWSVVTRS